MSDTFRKDTHTKMGEKMTPDATKSTQQKMKEGITDTIDKTARGVQPDHDKSASQSMMDKTGRASDREVHGGSAESIGDKFKGALGMDKHH